MFEQVDDPLAELRRLGEVLDNLPNHCRLRLQPFFKHSDDKPEVEDVFDAGLLAFEVGAALEQARTLQGLVGLGRAIWQIER